MFTALAQANVDWNVVAGAIATFVITAIATALGFRKGIKQSKTPKTEIAPIAGATLMDNMTMMMLTEALKENTELHRQIYGCLVELKTILQIGINNHKG